MRKSGCAAVAALLVIVAEAPCAGQSPVEPKTPAAILSADKAWGNAEANGDAAFLDRLLAPDYQSIGADGKVTRKDAIIAAVRARGPSAAYRARVDEWRKQHPHHGNVILFGDTAVLTWVADDPLSKGAVQSSDIFAYQGGHWRAVYSQHSNA